MRHLISLIRDQRGATAIEYALIASLISIAAVSAFASTGGKVNGKYQAVNQSLDVM